MKHRWIIIFFVLSIVTGATGCGDNGPKSETGGEKGKEQTASVSKADEETSKASEGGELSKEYSDLILLNAGNPYCSTEAGYYYVSGTLENDETLKDGTPCHHIMYIDYATKQEVYLCSNTGCNHDTKDCTSVITEDPETMWNSEYLPFLYGGKLYILNLPYDSSGSVSSMQIAPEYEEMIESGSGANGQGVLYRMNPDGTGRETVYTFEEELNIKSLVFAEGNALYLETSKVSMEQLGENSTYQAAADRKMVCLDLDTKKLSDIYAFDDQGAKWGTWSVVGTTGSELILTRTIYPSDMTEEDYFESDTEAYMTNYMEKYKKSTDEYAFLNLAAGEIDTKYQISNEVYHYEELKDGCLYMTFEKDNRLVKVDLESGEETTLLQDDRIKDGVVWEIYDDYISLNTDKGLYLVDDKNGRICKAPLTDSLGWQLTIRAENSDFFLVIYDYDAVLDELNDGGYMIEQYKFALAGKQDLFSGKIDYQPIAMSGKGE